MAQTYDITDRHKGEAIEILLLAKNPDQSVITDPNNQTITVAISETVNGAPIQNLVLSESPYVVLLVAETGEYFIQLTDAVLTNLTEGLTYYYNIWSQLNSEPRRLQAKGKIVLGGSIGF